MSKEIKYLKQLNNSDDFEPGQDIALIQARLLQEILAELKLLNAK